MSYPLGAVRLLPKGGVPQKLLVPSLGLYGRQKPKKIKTHQEILTIVFTLDVDESSLKSQSLKVHVQT